MTSFMALKYKSASWPSFPDPVTTGRRLLGAIVYHGYTIWLFTFSDLKTIVIPQTSFGVITAFSQARAGPNVQGSGEITRADVLQRIPLTLFWVYITLLPFAINNQRVPEAIEEDAINKPWRPMPTGRWSPQFAKYVMLALYAFAFVISCKIGGLRSNAALIFLGTWYNNMGGADMHALARNLINALGYASFGIGALEISLNYSINFNLATLTAELDSPNLEKWLVVVALVIMTTVQMQDLEDQVGDAQRGRLSVPVQFGDAPARWSVAIPMLFWGLFCPYLWQCVWLGYVVCTSLAFTIAYRVLAFRTVMEDKLTFRMWNLWVLSLYCLPLTRSLL